MKKLILGSTLAVAFSLGAFAQGQISLDNTLNTNASKTATANGLVWIGATTASAVLLGSATDPNFAASSAISGNAEDDINIQLLGGSSVGSMAVIQTWLMSDGSAFGDNIFAQASEYGLIIDPAGASLTVSGVALSGIATMEVLAWAGTYNSYAAAVGNTYAGSTGAFLNPVSSAGPPPGPATALSGMPALILTNVPEPTTFALMGFGSLSLLLFRRRK